MLLPPPEEMLAGTGPWAYVIISIILLLEAVPLFGAFIPAQLFLLGAGFLASIGELRLGTLLVVAFVSLFVADVVAFALGRRYGTRLLRRLPHALARRAHALSHGLAEHLGKTLVLGKFLGPARALAPPLAGNARVAWWRFLLWEALGCFLWVSIITALGYVFGRSYHVIERNLGRSAFVIVLAALVLYLGVQRFRAARQEERDERAEALMHEHH